MRYRVKVLAVCSVLALLVAACNGDDVITPVGEGFLDEPVNLVFLMQDPRTSPDPNVLPDYFDGAMLAVDEINEEGGIGGFPVEWEFVETPPFGEEVVDAFNLGLQRNPTAFIGPVSSTALLTMAERAGEAGIPVVHMATEPQAARSGEAGSDWVFATRPLNNLMAKAAATYAIEEVEAERIGLMYINVSFGQQGSDAHKEVIAEHGAAVHAERSFDFNADDLTEEVLAMSGADAIIDWGTPNTTALAVRTLAQQGLTDIHHIVPAAPGFAFWSDIVADPALLENVTGILDCNPLDDAHAADFRERFVDRFGYEPSYAAAETYDSILILRQVIEDAEAADPDSIREGLEDVTFTDGACASEYRNSDNILHHEAVIVAYEDGELVTIERYDDITEFADTGS